MQLTRLFGVLLAGMGLVCVEGKADDTAGEDKAKATFGDKTIERTVQLRTHSLYAPYIDQDLQNRWWDFGGDAYVNTNKHIRLTRDRPSQMGWLWSRLPLTSGNWVMEVEFKISGSSTNLFGDGMAIWVSKTRAQTGPVFGSVDNFEGFAVFLDTYANSRHPYAFPRITGMLNSGNTSYNVGNDGDKQGVGSCSLNFRRTNVATKVKITYIKDTLIDVKVQYKAWDDWTDCFRHNIGKGIGMPNAPFVGFSAMTGDVSDNHDIIAVSTYSAIMSDRYEGATGGGKNKKTGKKTADGDVEGGWGWTFFKLLLFIAVGAGGWAGWREYKRRGGFSGLGGGFGGGRGQYGGLGGYNDRGGGMGMGSGMGSGMNYGGGGGGGPGGYGASKRY